MSIQIGKVNFINTELSVRNNTGNITNTFENTVFQKDSVLTPQKIYLKNSENIFTNNEIEINQEISHNIQSIENLPDFSVTPFKIGLEVAKKQVTFFSENSKLMLKTSEGIKEIYDLKNQELTIKNENNSLIVFDSNNKPIGIFTDKLFLETDNPVKVNGKKYRGNLEIFINPLDNSTLNAVNTVLLEDYLKGVVPGESPASWPIESLKAQAVAARTYAVANWKKRDDMGFDLMPTTSDQVYKGMDSEQLSTNTAVKETNGEVLIFNNKPINALFHANSGGYTDSAIEVWGKDLPYIQGVEGYDEEAPRGKWTKTFDNSSIREALDKLEINIGDIKDIIPLDFTKNNRVKNIKFVGTNGNEIVDANKFRFALGMYSTLWEVNSSDKKKFSFRSFENVPKSFTFNGKGWGHGLGMSQWGAMKMSEKGINYNDILLHYYTNVEIENLYKK